MTLVWHPQVRQRATGERLCYFRFTLNAYLTTQLVERLDGILSNDTIAIRSYALYETLGSHDYLLRCWIPSASWPAHTRRALKDGLKDLGCRNLQDFLVDRVVWHKAFPDAQRDFGVGALDGIPIRTVDAHNDEVAELYFAAAATQVDVDDLIQGDEVSADVQSVVDTGLVAPIYDGAKGVRFHVEFQPSRPLDDDDIADITMRLVRACESAVATASETYPEASQPEISIYEGYGAMTADLVVVRSPDGHFYSFLRTVLRSIADEGFTSGYGVRPVTTVYASRRAAMIRENLAGESLPAFDEESLATVQESDVLELKATAWLDFARALQTGESKSFSGGVTTIAKTACAMLNNAGGLIVVGVGETERLKRDSQRNEVLEKFVELGLPVTPNEDLVVTGLESDFEAPDKKNVTDWDSWMRELQHAIAKRVSPDPFNLLLLNMERMVLSDTYGGRTLGLIQVGRPTDRDLWFYYENKFYARREGRNELLEGQPADEYRRALLGK